MIKQKIKVKDFSLETTLKSGQFFSWRSFEDGYLVWSGAEVFWIRQVDNKLNFEGIEENKLVHLFSLDEDYERITQELKKDAFMEKAVNELKGLRIMRQDFYSCLIGFVCSANANIPKITKNIHLLSEFFGEIKEILGETVFLFPKPKKLCDYDKIREAKTGFRAKYICKINEIVDERYIQNIKKMNYEQAKEKLIELPGVGIKIAECVCSFALGHPQAFPVDVWIRRIMQENYFNNKEVKDGEIMKFAKEYFGKNAAYANQFMYHYSRTQSAK